MHENSGRVDDMSQPLETSLNIHVRCQYNAINIYMVERRTETFQLIFIAVVHLDAGIPFSSPFYLPVYQLFYQCGLQVSWIMKIWEIWIMLILEIL